MSTNTKHIPDSDASEDSEVDIIHTFEPEENKDTSPPQSTLSHRFRESPQKTSDNRKREKNSDDSIAVMVPAPERPWEYQPFRGDTTVDTVLEVKIMDSNEWYTIEYENGKRELIPLEKLLSLPNGPNALEIFEIGEEIEESQNDGHSSAEPGMSSSVGKRNRTTTTRDGFVPSSVIPVDFGSDEDLSEDEAIVKKRRLEKGRISLLTSNNSRQGSRVSSRLSSRPQSRTYNDEESSDSELDQPNSRSTHPNRGNRSSARTTRSSTAKSIIKLLNRSSKSIGDDDELDELARDGLDESDNSDIVYRQPNQKTQTTKGRRGRSSSKGRRGRPRLLLDNDSSPSPERATRRSGRERVVKSMRERDMEEDIYADDVPTNNAPKVISIREVFQPLPKDSPFRLLHNRDCDVCGGTGSISNKGTSPLIYCQGCSTSIHKVCLGYRSGRDHMVTKVGHENFVMQCRRCIGVAARKDRSAPRLDTCQTCKETGPACAAFSQKKTAKQEEKLREENGGEDPITEVSGALINNSENVLFRCTSCQRSYHFEHLPTLLRFSETPKDIEELREERFKEYSRNWQCKDCLDIPAKVQGLVAWRLMDRESYVTGQTIDEFREDEKEYLIKWEDKSYFRCTWMPGSWVWGVTAVIMRNAFFRRDEGINLLPKWTSEEAIPEEFLRIEIVFDVSYLSGFHSQSESAGRAAINMVDEVLVKFQGLGYDDSVWEKPPDPEDEDRWSDFVAAYNEYVAGQYFKSLPAATMKERVDDFRSLNFEKKVVLKKQPSALTGGKMMPYQMEGLNWLLYNFHQKKNVILADEMGLGKTIQIISLFASLVKGNPKCWPFLVVTPNSTCPNWRREIKKWAPALRVVTYYGGKKARDMAMKYELFPNGCTDLRAHVVVTSYEGPTDDSSKSFFRRVKWAGMIVDEGQRLKNDANQLYVALKALKVPYQVLLTGTPLQNNKRELFNLLQFLDKSINAAELDEEYEELTKENLPELHELIRPFFLRRTKLQVLKFLPPMAQVILPVTMSLVQKKLYKSILAKNPELIRSIFGQSKAALRPAERGNLNNILMQLRKCLCHPFVYSSAIEERTVGEAALHRNLVDASSKFQLLEIMLPKLRERGHRVLMFSQFLDQLDLVEDFLNGLELPFQRLDGRIGTLEKQKRIDQFNAPDSPLFAFLLSTRAGGVGINLATADTVIIMDPDFNPHQDIQALSRAHRIGQKNKVLVFQLMTKDTAEEKIVQIGRKKMALDQALIESMGAEDDAGVDLESILKHGAEALFNDDDRNDIHYDSASVDKLLDRTQVENTNTDDEKTAESQFSFARVWANDTGDLTEDIGDADAEPSVPNFSVWDKILKQREADAAAEAARNMQTFGRGKRARQTVDYQKIDLDDEMPESSPLKQSRKRRSDESASDLDFAAAGESDGDDDSDVGKVDPRELEPPQERSRGSIATSTPPKGTVQSSLSTTPKKVGYVKPKATATEKSASNITPPTSGKTATKQQGSVKKSSVLMKVPTNPPSKLKAPISSNKTVGSKNSEAVKAQEHPEKKKSGSEIKQATATKPAAVKKGDSTSSHVLQQDNDMKKPPIGKDTKVLQQKKQEVTAVNQPVPSKPSEAKNTNLGSTKTTNIAKIVPNSSNKQISQAYPASRKAKVIPEPAVKAASAVIKPVAPKIDKVLQASMILASATDRSHCPTKFDTPTSATLNALNSLNSYTSSFKAVALSLETLTDDETLETALQIANHNEQTTDTTLQITVRNSAVRCKKDPLNLPHLFSEVQTQSTLPEASSQSPISALEDRECTKMQVVNHPEPQESRCTRMEVDLDRGMTEPDISKKDLDNESEMREPLPRLLQFSLVSEMEDLAVRIHPSHSAISANAATT